MGKKVLNIFAQEYSGDDLWLTLPFYGKARSNLPSGLLYGKSLRNF